MFQQAHPLGVVRGRRVAHFACEPRLHDDGQAVAFALKQKRRGRDAQARVLQRQERVLFTSCAVARVAQRELDREVVRVIRRAVEEVVPAAGHAHDAPAVPFVRGWRFGLREVVEERRDFQIVNA